MPAVGHRQLRLRLRVGLSGATAVALCAGLQAAPANATTATATILPGPLGVTPGPLHMTTTPVQEAFEETTLTQSLRVTDATGSGASWAITVAPMPAPGEGRLSISNARHVEVTATAACGTRSSCHMAPGVASTAGTLPFAPFDQNGIKVFRAVKSGQGDEAVTLTWGIAVPQRAKLGVSATAWTLSLTTGP